LWLHSLKVAQLLRSAACLHTNQSRSYLNHLVHVSHIQQGIFPRMQLVPLVMGVNATDGARVGQSDTIHGIS